MCNGCIDMKIDEKYNLGELASRIEAAESRLGPF